MGIVRKLKTARAVLLNDGLREAFALFCDNLVAAASHAARAPCRAASLVYYRAAAALPRVSKKTRVLYVTSEFEAHCSQTVRYRVHNVRRALRGGAHTRFALLGARTLFQAADWADLIVLMRVTWTHGVGALIGRADKRGIPVVFDIDDLIFLPRFAPDYCRVLGKTGAAAQEEIAAQFTGFHKTFINCRFATASTPFIADIMEKEGRRAFVIHNGLNQRQLRTARRALRTKKPGARTVGYLSGTATHDRDFLQALPALEKILAVFPDVTLRVAGYLDLSALPPAVAARTRSARYMRPSRLMRYSAGNTINIAPLDLSNPFCHAKSELKYFEAAAVGVPTVASRTDTFARAIENGVNGMLASNDKEWYNALKRLLSDGEFYRAVSKNARAHALAHFAPAQTAREALGAYRSILSEFYGAGGKRG